MACIALLLALGGTGYAAFKLPANSVSSINVRDRSLLAKDFARNVLLQGKPGAQGPQGPAGPAGAAGPAGPSGATAMRWALFNKDGAIVNQSSDMRLVTRPTAGSYIVNVGSPARGKAIIVSTSFAGGDTAARGSASVSPCGGPPEGIACPANNDGNHVWLFTYSPAGAPSPHAFYLVVLG